MSRSLKVALITDAYPPLKTSAAVQMKDLAHEFAALGHQPVVIVPTPAATAAWTLVKDGDVDVLGLAAPASHVHGHLRRAIAEMLMPFAMMRSFNNSPLRGTQWNLIVWYSPTIFFGPLVWALSRTGKVRKYLILRDIFPEWAVDLGLLSRGPVYWFFKLVAAFQYSAANVIGVQTKSNIAYLQKYAGSGSRKIEVLPNWLTAKADTGCGISIAKTPLAGRKIFVYIGNMGVAQSMDILIDLAKSLLTRKDIGFLFVGRGSEYNRLLSESISRRLTNVMFHDEIDPSEVPGLLAQCHVGLLALHPAHKTHNIPGKFISYVHYGLPVLACLNAGTDLFNLIEDEGVGRAYVGTSTNELQNLLIELADNDLLRLQMSERGKELGRKLFSSRSAATQIIAAFPL